MASYPPLIPLVSPISAPLPDWESIDNRNVSVLRTPNCNRLATTPDKHTNHLTPRIQSRAVLRQLAAVREACPSMCEPVLEGQYQCYKALAPPRLGNAKPQDAGDATARLTHSRNIIIQYLQ